MEATPKSNRLQIGIFGRTNVGKSSFLNMMCGQDIAVTSPIPGTTTDVVEKVLELLPLGPVVLLDSAGIDDATQLADKRLKKTHALFNRADVVILILEAEKYGEFEENIVNEALKRKLPCVAVVNKIDEAMPSEPFVARLTKKVNGVVCVSSIKQDAQVEYRQKFIATVHAALPPDFLLTPPLLGDLVRPGGLAIFIVPIDLQAPKGRLILPQVQSIRDILDNDAAVMVVKEREYSSMLSRLTTPPDLVVCDSQVVLKMVADTPSTIPATTFSILFARAKGDLVLFAKGARAIKSLKDGAKVLIAEACSHHAAEDDIGRVKIPRWLRQYTGCDLTIDVACGRDFPDDLTSYAIVVGCGSCMLTRRETMNRQMAASEQNVPLTNYGICISALQGVVERVLSPFPAALYAYTKK